MALRSRLVSDPNEVLLALDEIGSELSDFSVSEDSEKSDNSLPISSKEKRTSLGSLISRLHNVILFYKVGPKIHLCLKNTSG